MEPDSSASTADRRRFFERDLIAVAGTEVLPRSHELVACPADNCSIRCRRGDMSRHFLRAHQDCEYVPGDSLPLTTFFKRRRTDATDVASSGGHASGADRLSTTPAGTESVSTGAGADETADEAPNADSVAVANLHVVTTPDATAAVFSDTAAGTDDGSGVDQIDEAAVGGGNVLTRIFAWMRRIEDVLLSLPQRIVERLQRAQEEKEQNARLARIVGNTVEDVAAGNDLELHPELHEVRCRPCSQWGSRHLTPSDLGITGIFSTEQPVASLKKSLVRHMLKPAHKACVEAAAR
eukprot:GHVU01228815.1.p1 GENE.GHVU01228815.1~~GHVU01228815.1.p1  ORF type:complete len:294 (+),score=29.89 GHVU01228815.1:381-1262(+)